jgi:hypothetical protein
LSRVWFSFLFFSSVGLAQQENYFLSRFSPTDERLDHLTFGMNKDAKGVIYFANKNCVPERSGIKKIRKRRHQSANRNGEKDSG